MVFVPVLVSQPFESPDLNEHSSCSAKVASSLNIEIVLECSFSSWHPKQDQVPYISLHKHESVVASFILPVMPCIWLGPEFLLPVSRRAPTPLLPVSCLAE